MWIGWSHFCRGCLLGDHACLWVTCFVMDSGAALLGVFYSIRLVSEQEIASGRLLYRCIFVEAGGVVRLGCMDIAAGGWY